ncbi:hypothetical protein BDW74DRAFT_151994 [Aspergillus multicolor]|uniref:uncharacterized protein n=1 Tax=Aspergillus multicolor TaxID=41759 RepID=UPI003CCCCB8E
MIPERGLMVSLRSSACPPAFLCLPCENRSSPGRGLSLLDTCRSWRQGSHCKPELQ